MSVLLLAAFLAAPQPQPLIGTWIRERSPAIDRMDAARPPTLTITPDAMLFAQGRQLTDSKRVTRFDTEEKGDRNGKGRVIAVETGDGPAWRFRFTDKDHICRVRDERSRMPTLGEKPQCWRRTTPEKAARNPEF